MSSRTNTPDALHSAKNASAPSMTGEQLQIAALAPDSTTDAASIPDALRAEWARIVAEFDRNIEAFEAYVENIRERIAENDGWTGGTDHLRSFIRDGRFVRSDGSSFKVGHNNTAVWCREICRRWPDVKPHILPTLRPSKFDVFYRSPIFSDEYVAALKQANARPDELEEA